MRNLLIALACAKLCASLGYQWHVEDPMGCICAERVDSLRVISNFKAKLVGEVIVSEDKPPPPKPATTYEADEGDY